MTHSFFKKKDRVSDPRHIDLYQRLFVDKIGLQVYRCKRGTNTLEGGVHQNVIRMFGAFNADPELAQYMLQEYFHRHNMSVGYYNRKGVTFKYHYDVWTTKRIADLYMDLDPSLAPPHIVLWSSIGDYDVVNESFGIVPIPDAVRSVCSMEPFSPDNTFVKRPFNRPSKSAYFPDQNLSYTNNGSSHLGGRKGFKFSWLARQQGTKYPVLPVQSLEEIKLFKKMVNAFDNQRKIDWVALAAKWNSENASFQQRIFYKLPDHLESHFKSSHLRYNNFISTKIANSDLIATFDSALKEASAPSMKQSASLPGFPMSESQVDKWKGLKVTTANSSPPIVISGTTPPSSSTASTAPGIRQKKKNEPLAPVSAVSDPSTSTTRPSLTKKRKLEKGIIFVEPGRTSHKKGMGTFYGAK